jgi:hypothetical protein
LACCSKKCSNEVAAQVLDLNTLATAQAPRELTKRLSQHTEVFMHGRLTSPPQGVYSLHRKLAGAFLMRIKLRAAVSCRDVLEDVHAKYYAK